MRSRRGILPTACSQAGDKIPRSEANATAILMDGGEHDSDLENVIIFSGKVRVSAWYSAYSLGSYYSRYGLVYWLSHPTYLLTGYEGHDRNSPLTATHPPAHPPTLFLCTGRGQLLQRREPPAGRAHVEPRRLLGRHGHPAAHGRGPRARRLPRLRPARDPGKSS